MSQVLLGSVVRCLVGRIEGVMVISLNGRIGGVGADFDPEAEVEVDLIPPPVLRCRVPARVVLGLV